MDARTRFQAVIRSNNLNSWSLGALVGLQSTAEERKTADENSKAILEFLQLIPEPGELFICEAPLLNQNGLPLPRNERCGLILRHSSEPGRSPINYRLFCSGKHLLEGKRVDLTRQHRPLKLNPLLGTILENAKIKFRKFLMTLHCFFIEEPVTRCARLAQISIETAVNYYSQIREALAVCGWHDVGKIGGPGDVVEIDEVHLFKRKHNTGRLPRGHYWIFGGVSRATKKWFAMRVAYRNGLTLNAEILDSIETGSIICSDGWAAYQGVGNLRGANNQPVYRAHYVVIHNTNFVNPPRGDDPMWISGILPACIDTQFVGPFVGPDLVTGVERLPFRCHTQRQERSRRELRKTVKSTVDLGTVDRYIGYWMYKENSLRNMGGNNAEKFLQMVADIRRVYPGINVVKIRANRPGVRMYANAAQVILCECENCTN